MSYVSNALLTTRYLDKASESALVSKGWACVNQHAGGPKWWEADTFMKAFNHTLMDDIVAEAAACLSYSDGCLLVIHDEADEDDEVHIWFRSVRSQAFEPVQATREDQ